MVCGLGKLTDKLYTRKNARILRIFKRCIFNGNIEFHSPCCAKWQSASSMWRLISDASLLAFCTIHGSAPSSIKRERPLFDPEMASIAGQ